ncbi:MAG: hypothetical protein O7G83_00985 [Proteobacteria bacterium]|nr:hypothetical protein [Pseudomonadota bacterium]
MAPKHAIALCLMLAAAVWAPAGFAQVSQSTADDGHGTALTPALDELVPRLKSAADHRDSEAAVALAILTLEDRNNADLEQAVTSLKAAAGDGRAEAALALGNAYFEGRTVTADSAAALNWWRNAAKLGAVDAQYNLGLVLLQRGQNTAEGLVWLDRAAEASHVLACFAAGSWYAAREQQAARAERHLNCAARQGYAPAQYNLARWHLEKQRTDLARTWFEAAAVTFEPALRALESLPARASAPSVSSASIVAGVKRAEPESSSGAIHGVEWVKAQPHAHFTLQVAASRSGVALKLLLRQHARGEDSAYFLHRPRAREPFSAVVGSYDDYAVAERRLADLPPAIMANRPWIRYFGTLQRELRRSEHSARKKRVEPDPNAEE